MYIIVNILCRKICNIFALPKSFSTSTNRLVIALPDFNTACNSKRSDHGGWLSFCHVCERYTRYVNDFCHNHKRLSVPIATSPHDAIAQLHMYNFHSRSFTRSPTLMRSANTMTYCALRSNSANTLSHTSLLITSCIMTSPNLESAQRKLARHGHYECSVQFVLRMACINSCDDGAVNIPIVASASI